MRRSISLAAAVAASLVLAACGGGSDDDTSSDSDDGTDETTEETSSDESSSETESEGGETDGEAAPNEEGTLVVWDDETRQAAVEEDEQLIGLCRRGVTVHRGEQIRHRLVHPTTVLVGGGDDAVLRLGLRTRVLVGGVLEV